MLAATAAATPRARSKRHKSRVCPPSSGRTRSPGAGVRSVSARPRSRSWQRADPAPASPCRRKARPSASSAITLPPGTRASPGTARDTGGCQAASRTRSGYNAIAPSRTKACAPGVRSTQRPCVSARSARATAPSRAAPSCPPPPLVRHGGDDRIGEGSRRYRRALRMQRHAQAGGGLHVERGAVDLVGENRCAASDGVDRPWEDVVEQRQGFVADAIAAEPRCLIQRVGMNHESPRKHVGGNVVARYREQRTENLAVVLPHSRQPTQPGSAGQIHEDGLRLVMAGVSGSDARGLNAPRNRSEKRPPSVTGVGFRRRAVRRTDRIVAGRAGGHGQAGVARVPDDGSRQVRSVGTQPVVQMRHVHGRSAPAPCGQQTVQQHHGIWAA